MDKYEFNIKVEQIKKMAAKGDYETAMKIADTIDWRRVRNVNILSMAASVYEKTRNTRRPRISCCWPLSVRPSVNAFCISWRNLPLRRGTRRRQRIIIGSSATLPLTTQGSIFCVI